MSKQKLQQAPSGKLLCCQSSHQQDSFTIQRLSRQRTRRLQQRKTASIV